jgi:hypothetical protein
MNTEIRDYLRRMVENEMSYLRSAIMVEDRIADTTEVPSDAQTAADRAKGYREQLAKAQAAKDALGEPEQPQQEDMSAYNVAIRPPPDDRNEPRP